MAVQDTTFNASDFWHADDNAYFTRKQVATVIHYSVSALEQWAVKGGGPVMVKMGRKVLYQKKAVLDWVGRTARTITSTSALMGG